ncbi:MAG: response regulator [Nitrospirales bacterium]
MNKYREGAICSTFFLTDLPPSIAESTLRKLLRDDLSVSVSFRDSPAGTVAMVEARNAQEAQRAAGELTHTTLGGGTPLTVVAPETPEGRQLQLIFAFSEKREQRACGGLLAYSACVLIVDDDPMCLLGMQELVSFHLPHVCVHAADSGQTAVTLNGRREFDAILSDVQMPGLDGFSLVEEIKRIRPHTPVVLMTATAHLMSLMVKSGAFGFMRKPVNRRYCVASLQHAIMYSSLSKLVANARLHSPKAMEPSAGLLWLAKAELGESLTRWNQV